MSSDLFFEEEELALMVTPQELASIVLGLYHEIIERCLWALSEGHWLRSRPIESVQNVVNPLVSGYQKAMLLIRELEDRLDPDYIPAHSLSDEQWRLLDKITTATSWKDIPLG